MMSTGLPFQDSTNSVILRTLDLSNKSYQRQEKYTCLE